MPCNTIQTAAIALGKVDSELLAKAMAEQGYNESEWRLENDTVIIRGQRATPELTAQVKQHYSKQVVYSQAKKYGWLIKETAPFQYQVTKR